MSRNGNEKKLVLGFDAGCGTCAEIARRVEERVGDALAVRNLSEPEVAQWREEALGPDAPFAPTLFEVDSGGVRAWTGKGMALPLSRKLGLSKTWQLMQALGEMPNAGIQNVDAAPRAGMSRGAFLKGVGGAAVAMSVLSGTGPLASVAQAADLSPFDIIDSKPIKGSELQRIVQRVALNSDVKNVSGTALSSSAKVAEARKGAARHKLRNGVFVTVTTYAVSTKRLIVHSQYSRQMRKMATSIAQVLVLEDANVTIVKVSENGRLWRRSQSASTSRIPSSSSTQPLGECPPVNSRTPGGCPVYYERVCVKWKQSTASQYGCVAWRGGGYALNCVECGASQAASRTPLGRLGRLVGGATVIYGCAGCSTPGDVLDGCSTCEVSVPVERVDYARCS